MNEFENKLRSLPFREPPADLRRSVLAAAQARDEKIPAWTWRDWLWPAPPAWAALGLILTAALTTNALIGVAPERKVVTVTVASPASKPTTLFAFQPRGRQVAWLDTLH